MRIMLLVIPMVFLAGCTVPNNEENQKQEAYVNINGTWMWREVDTEYNCSKYHDVPLGKEILIDGYKFVFISECDITSPYNMNYGICGGYTDQNGNVSIVAPSGIIDECDIYYTCNHEVCHNEVELTPLEIEERFCDMKKTYGVCDELVEAVR